MTNKIDTVLKAITDRIAGTLPSDTVKNLKLSTYPVLSARSYPTEDPQCSTHIHMVRIYSLTIHPSTVLVRDDDDIMFIEIVKTNDDSHKEEPEVKEQEVEYLDILPTRSELSYHKYFRVSNPAYVLRNPILKEGCPLNLKIPCNIRHVHVEKA
ncbi:hypothetical protein Tco_0347183 [Tanacetum coccineum]